MFISPPPPSGPPRIAPAEEVRPCPRFDPKCYIDLANDVLKGVANSFNPSALSSIISGGGAIASPGTGHVQVTGYAPEVILGPRAL